MTMVAKKRDPSPREIRHACAEIRKHWTKNRRRARRVQKRAGWTLPLVHCDLTRNGSDEHPSATAFRC